MDEVSTGTEVSEEHIGQREKQSPRGSQGCEVIGLVREEVDSPWGGMSKVHRLVRGQAG